MLRDADGKVAAIERLRQRGATEDPTPARLIRERVTHLLDRLPLFQLPGAIEAMRLLDEIALEGIRFPAALLMFRKAFFTLEGVLEDILGAGVRLDLVIGRYALSHWVDAGAVLFSLLSLRDWMALDWSALTLASRLGVRALARPWRWIPGLSSQAGPVQYGVV